MESYQRLLDQNVTVSQLHYLAKDFAKYGIYADSVQSAAGTIFFIARDDRHKFLVANGPAATLDRLEGEMVRTLENVKECPLNEYNCNVLREYFPYMNPVSHKTRNLTLGLGDRLGFATPGHLRLLKKYPVFPVVAQQSVRELELTNRSFASVLCDVSWAVFQEGYTQGFGADGDHLKTREEVEAALDAGYTMITLDCSAAIDNSAYELDEKDRKESYDKLPAEYRNRMENTYLGRKIVLKNGEEVPYDMNLYYLTVLVYHRAIDFAAKIYQEAIRPCGRHIDFEVSIDETLVKTDPIAHYIVAAELLERGVDLCSIAPKFVGEFQKGVDYIGDTIDFENDFELHERIADHFGYKISIHSGSDKFSIFPIVGEKAKKRFHLKTSGTNWLQFLLLVAMERPALFRRIYAFAKEHFEEAKQYYHVWATPERFPVIDRMPDEGLVDLFRPEQLNARQLLHITYGPVLQARKPDGSFLFRDELYQLGLEKENAYYELLSRHIGKHLAALGVKPLHG